MNGLYADKNKNKRVIIMRLKRILLLVCSAAVLLTSCGNSISSGKTDTASSVAKPVTSSQKANETKPTETTTVTTTATAAAPMEDIAPSVTEPYSKASAVYCVDDKKLLCGSNMNGRISIASTTKLMTASVALKYLSPATVVTVGTELSLVQPDSTLCLIYQGCKLTLSELLMGLLIPSGNDAAYTVAVTVARSLHPGEQLSDQQAVKIFCELMNQFAAELGMTSTHFANPEGWDNPDHYSTLSDMIKLSEYALTVPEISEIIKTPQKTMNFVTGGYASWTNNNYFVIPGSGYYSPDAIGMKTGTTDDAGYCLISAFVRGGKTYICAAMGCNTDLDRFTLTRELIQAYT